VSDKIFSSDWFSHNIPNWEAYIDEKRPMDVLELGAFEGRSTVWMMENLNIKSLIAVDDWNAEALSREGYYDTEKNFDHNIKDYKNIKKWIASTYSFLKNNDKMFDLIYIDAGHMGYSVLTDAVMAHYFLKPGGYLIFDDYSQSTDPKRIDRPRGAINAFCEQFGTDYITLHVDYQMMLQKKGL
jgi:predicted O-methyltransferase YrrM